MKALFPSCKTSKFWCQQQCYLPGSYKSLFPQGFHNMTYLDHIQFLPSLEYFYLVYFYCSLNYLHIHINSRMYKWAPLWFLHHSLYDNITYECYLQVSRQTCGRSKFVGQQHPDICFQFACMFSPVIFHFLWLY